jgi:hypothetical protein
MDRAIRCTYHPYRLFSHKSLQASQVLSPVFSESGYISSNRLSELSPIAMCDSPSKARRTTRPDPETAIWLILRGAPTRGPAEGPAEGPTALRPLRLNAKLPQGLHFELTQHGKCA